jgi:hypothetical protein
MMLLALASGSVPGDVEVGSIELHSGGHGAGPGCYLTFLLKVLFAICMGLTLVSSFFKDLYVKCNATAVTNG